ncbi:hypothetical protein BCR33DRAFT_234612 [Rhizoclosmatium globosum]|uniref:Uncharacterized protein n=1 Tax=Rhizoclosmatium globosum TaxID=329046 RepID=A0A1Y2CAL1_9FUNG|nr:hypothetical protein BCR33DRAFT_234612 [Rhizoclosmatium globosum]|eukprot:ORY44070.1 hypothetical protein BCR33DRAFT_234612 [Rhizoclosmatium globosum]
MEGGLPETLYRFNVIGTRRLPSGSPIHSHVPPQHHNQIKSELQHPPLNYTNQPIYQPNVYQSNAYHNLTSNSYTNPAIPSIQPTVHIPLAYPCALYREPLAKTDIQHQFLLK